MRYKLIIVFTVISSFTVGCITTILIKKSKLFTFSNEIKLTEGLSIVTTVLLALFIAYFVEKNKENNRNTKDMFISYYNSYLDFLKSNINETLKEDKLQKRYSKLKLVRTRLYSLDKISKERKLLKENNELLKNLTKEVSELWRLCTEKQEIDDSNMEQIQLILFKVEVLIYKISLEINEN